MTANERFLIKKRLEQTDESTNKTLRQSLEKFRLGLEAGRMETEQNRVRGTIQWPSYNSDISRYKQGIDAYKTISRSLPK